MSALHHVPVDAYSIHKEHVDDVLISNFRATLPTYLNPDEFKHEFFGDEQRALLAKHYVNMDTIRDARFSNDLSDGLLVRRSVPFALPPSAIDEWGFICEYYKWTGNEFVLHAKYMREEHEVMLMNRYVDPDSQISAYERHQISLLTDQLSCNNKPSGYYVNMINDLQNYYFYRKHHEHVPGIMLVEVARQAVYAQYYRTSAFKRGEVTLTIKKLDCNFEGYIDSNYPVVVCTETNTDENERRETGFERRIARFFQKGRIKASVEILGIPIKMSLFKRLRMVKPEPGHWFVPVKAFARSAIFVDQAGKKIEGRLKKVSRGGMEIAFNRHLDPEMMLDFVLSVEGVGYVDGKVTLDELHEDGDDFVGRLSIAQLSLDAERKWFEAIKNFSHVECRPGTH